MNLFRVHVVPEVQGDPRARHVQGMQHPCLSQLLVRQPHSQLQKVAQHAEGQVRIEVVPLRAESHLTQRLAKVLLRVLRIGVAIHRIPLARLHVSIGGLCRQARSM